jgi:hypothetical protein
MKYQLIKFFIVYNIEENKIQFILDSSTGLRPFWYSVFKMSVCLSVIADLLRFKPDIIVARSAIVLSERVIKFSGTVVTVTTGQRANLDS